MEIIVAYILLRDRALEILRDLCVGFSMLVCRAIGGPRGVTTSAFVGWLTENASTVERRARWRRVGSFLDRFWRTSGHCAGACEKRRTMIETAMRWRAMK